MLQGRALNVAIASIVYKSRIIMFQGINTPVKGWYFYYTEEFIPICRFLLSAVGKHYSQMP